MQALKKGKITNMNYRKICITIFSVLLLLSSCSKANGVQNPNEVSVSGNVLKYSDTQSSVEGKLGEGKPAILYYNDAYNYNDMVELLYNKDGNIRCLNVLDSKVKTFHNISIGDNADKITNTYKYEFKTANSYMVLFNGKQEVDMNDKDKSEDWIWIIYHLDNNDKIDTITIYDMLFGQKFK